VKQREYVMRQLCGTKRLEALILYQDRHVRPLRHLHVLALIQQYSGEHALFYSCLIRSIPRKYGRKASGMMTDPSACW
jgi:hypothetical protein